MRPADDRDERKAAIEIDPGAGKREAAKKQLQVGRSGRHARSREGEQRSFADDHRDLLLNLRRPAHAHVQMVLQVAAYSRQVDDDRNLEVSELLGWTNARLQQDFGRVQGSHAHDYFG